MDYLEHEYHGEFTIEQRKAMTAQMLQELRKAKKLSQKEVAAYLNIPATTYNTYESGRTEPPIEILVRLSYLYEMPIDVIVQRDRTYKTAEEISDMMAAARQEIDGFAKKIAENGTNAPGAQEIVDVMKQLAGALQTFSQTEAAKKAIDIPDNK